MPNDVFAFARKYFTEDELVKLTLAVVTINGWNRFAISFRSEAGMYQPVAKKTPRLKRRHSLRFPARLAWKALLYPEEFAHKLALPRRKAC